MLSGVEILLDYQEIIGRRNVDFVLQRQVNIMQMDIDMEMEHLPTLDECNEMSNAMGEAAGISNNTL